MVRRRRRRFTPLLRSGVKFESHSRAPSHPELLAILRCPRCRVASWSEQRRTRSTALGGQLRYAVQAGVPDLLLDDAVSIGAAPKGAAR